jgi:hypothetical protein
MRKGNEEAVAVRATSPDDVAERHAPPEAFYRERSDEKNDARSHELELRIEPRRAERDLRR